MTKPLGPDVELRVMLERTVVIGPVKVSLLEEILLAGSISAAQRRPGVGEVYAWKLVAAMNDRFSLPLVEVARGGHFSPRPGPTTAAWC
jgi:molybdate transport system regulatory protein